ncbi:hypothetical protein SAMN05216249_1236 [Acetitomaculum ruminis DSM 5522]|uniref:Uncharacterized protein n=1 Tax=Acetitomaculum ruminis DSM 5522 TaxID=1120918 RepID=A0A1I1A910_9FIRM|nr:hypothetical protein [Acetitomaculum ruminis]SFB34441.1 hypothetical protein SAMN05216249_1236 [Acetitomaculum ruminis DSM 5522]
MKRVVNILLTFVFVVSMLFSPITTNAKNTGKYNYSKVSLNNTVESAIIDNIRYTFESNYYNNNRVIIITNEDTHEKEIMTYNALTGDVLIDGEVFMHFNNVSSKNTNVFQVTASKGPKGWTLFSQGKQKISKVKAMNVQRLASAIAVVLGSFASPVMVLTAMTVQDLGQIAGKYAGCTIQYKIYNYNSTIAMNYLHKWRTIAGKKTSKWYESMIAV